MMKNGITISILALIFFSTFTYSAEQKEYLSPDGEYRAIVVSLSKSSYGSAESEIFIKTKDGKILCSKDYSSEDGEHGFGVEKAAWTPDSKFFVYSLSSSGGHQAWHFPTDFISTIDGKVRRLDEFVGPVTDPSFALIAPDTIKTSGRDKTNLDETNFYVKLSELVK
jgi:dipeptidyl aminopeptidase/acylaminoacyl peptidase